MDECGVDLSAARPRSRSATSCSARADVVITMGCGDACPVYPGKRYEDWELEDPAGRDLEAVRAIRDEIEGRVRRLAAELGGRALASLTCCAARRPRASPPSRSSSRAAARSSPTRSTAASASTGIALVFGLVITVMIYATGHLSGAHINPAVTIAFTLTRHFPLRDAGAYISAQLAGAIAGALALLAIWPSEPAGLGATDALGRASARRSSTR